MDILYKFYQVKIHEPAVKRSFGLDASELALLFLCAEQVVEAVALVESKIALFVVGVYEQEAAARLVEWVNKPCLDETEHVATQMLALEVGADAQTANHHSGITAIELLTGDVLLHLLLARTGNLLDAVVGKGEGCNDGSRLFVEREAIVLAEQLVALQECILEEELVEVFVAAMERLALSGFLPSEESEAALLLQESHRLGCG